MFGLKSNFIKISIISILMIQLCSCAPRYQYTTLAPVDNKGRTAESDYESIKVGSVDFKLYKWDMKSFIKDIEKNKKLSKEEKRKLKTLRKNKYPLFLLLIEKKKDDVVEVTPAGIKAVFLSRYREDIEKSFRDIESTLVDNLLLNDEVILKDEKKAAFYIIFPYSVKEEHMLRIDISGIKVNEEDVELKYSFHSTDTWEKRKRILQYTGIGIGAIAIIVGGISLLQ
ncbi:MAG: hypothetical protein D6734_08085 [Candidatus Schekmanbacteria bacterium]|nr:MAG: hypothetical protein D6734_08085 [Candidatus Schekmanbacteria bacterium]